MMHLGAALLILTTVSTAPAAVDPAKKTLQASKRLRAYSDDEWKSIAGNQTSEQYEVVKGDSLSEISKRLFGDMKYWPKIWALNNGKIKNAHLVRPGMKVHFMPGTAGSLPSLSLDNPSGSPAEGGEDSGVKLADNSDWSEKKSDEWRHLPPQDWEPKKFPAPVDVDPLGFDKNSRITFSRNRGFDLPWLVTSEELIPLGEITGSRSEASGLTISDVVFIQPKDHLQIGETYSITDEPTTLKSAKSRRYGYSYPNLGRVKIVGVRDGVFVGRVTHAAGIVKRGHILVPLIQRVRELTLIPAPQTMEGVMMLDTSQSTYVAAQYKQVAVDRGASDGVRVGMIFRAYQYYDPHTDQRLTEADMLTDADFLVIQVSEHFSALLALSSLSVIPEGTSLVLLTDVSEVLNAKEVIEQIDSTQDVNQEKTLDDLDTLDQGEDVGRGEKKELKQLEEWKPTISQPPTEEVPASEIAPAPPEEAAPVEGARTEGEEPPAPPLAEGEEPPALAEPENDLNLPPPPPPEPESLPEAPEGALPADPVMETAPLTPVPAPSAPPPELPPSPPSTD